MILLSQFDGKPAAITAPNHVELQTVLFPQLRAGVLSQTQMLLECR
jgi:hypothetical protein